MAHFQNRRSTLITLTNPLSAPVVRGCFWPQTELVLIEVALFFTIASCICDVTEKQNEDQNKGRTRIPRVHKWTPAMNSPHPERQNGTPIA